MRKTKLILPAAICLLLSSCGTAIGTNEKITMDNSSVPETPAQITTLPTAARESEAESREATEAPKTTTVPDSSSQEEPEPGILTAPEDIGLTDTDGSGTNFSFTYDGKTFSAVYTYDNWKIVDSYKITNRDDMEIICQSLINVYPIHGKDMVSYRTAEDMAYEWEEHNFAYEMLPEDSKWKANTRDVDFNPEDQGKTALEMALDRVKD